MSLAEEKAVFKGGEINISSVIQLCLLDNNKTVDIREMRTLISNTKHFQHLNVLHYVT